MSDSIPPTLVRISVISLLVSLLRARRKPSCGSFVSREVFRRHVAVRFRNTLAVAQRAPCRKDTFVRPVPAPASIAVMPVMPPISIVASARETAKGNFPVWQFAAAGLRPDEALLDNYTDIHSKRFCPGRKIFGGIIGRRRKIDKPKFSVTPPTRERERPRSFRRRSSGQRGPRRLPPSPVR